MKKGTKVALGVGCGVLLLGGLAVLVGGYFVLNYLERTVGESVKEFEMEGREFGKATDQQGCMTEGMKRSKLVGLIDMSKSLALTTFVDACLETSRPSADFCQGVPSLWSMKDSEWGADLCRKAGIDPEKTGCVHVAGRKHQYCATR